MNILILTYEYPPLGGGTGVVSRYHAEGLSNTGHKVTVLTAWYKGEKEIEEIGNLKIIKLKSRRKYTYKSTPDEWISWIAKSKKFLSEYLLKNEFDYSFAHYALPSGEVARYIKRRFNLKYAVVSHGHDIPWFFAKQMFKYHIFTYFWIKAICNKSDKLILLTDNMKKNADRFMGKLKTKNIVIPNACEVNTFSPNYSIRSKKLKIIFVGRLVAQKDPFVFLKAIKLLSQKLDNNFEVKILGDGPLRAKMEKYCRDENINDVIEFKGWVTKDEILKEYQSSHLHIVTSLAEGMSIASLEALSTGLYSISTRVNGNTDIIAEGVNGYFIDYKDYENLATKIELFFHENYKKGITVNDEFLTQFRKKYSWENIVKELIKVLPNSN